MGLPPFACSGRRAHEPVPTPIGRHCHASAKSLNRQAPRIVAPKRRSAKETKVPDPLGPTRKSPRLRVAAVHLLLAPVPRAEKIDAAVLERPRELREPLHLARSTISTTPDSRGSEQTWEVSAQNATPQPPVATNPRHASSRSDNYPLQPATRIARANANALRARAREEAAELGPELSDPTSGLSCFVPLAFRIRRVKSPRTADRTCEAAMFRRWARTDALGNPRCRKCGSTRLLVRRSSRETRNLHLKCNVCGTRQRHRERQGV